MKVDTYIVGYTDNDSRDEVVLCALCGGPFFTANPKEWSVLRKADAFKYRGGRECDKCAVQVIFDPRLNVYDKFVSTLEF